jgi:hypothetical protein
MAESNRNMHLQIQKVAITVVVVGGGGGGGEEE